MDWLKEILKDYVGDDKLDEVITKTNEVFPKHAIPKNKFNSVNDELKEYKTKTDELQKQISDLSNSDKSKELQAELEKVTNEFSTFKGNTEKRELNRNKKLAIEKGLKGANAVDDALDLLTNTFDLETITLSEKGEVVDLESKLSKLKEEKPSLFKVKETSSTKTPSDANNDDSDNMDSVRKAMGL